MPDVMVFAPAPQLTVTVEDTEGGPEVHLHAGGQGFWQARMMAALGSKVVLCGTFGGETGQVLRGLISDTGIEVRCREVVSRNGAYVHDRRGGDRHEVAQMHADPLSRHELDDLYELAVVLGMEAGVAVLAGPADGPDGPLLPDAVYQRLADDLTRNGCQVVVDLAGGRLEAALAGSPTVVKVSHEELLADGRADDDSPEQLLAAARTIAEQGVRMVVVSRAGEPALCLHEERVLTMTAPMLQPVDTHGGGDSMTAGIAAGLAAGVDPETALRWGAAAGALNVARHGLGSGSGAAVRTLADRVTVSPVDQP